jgi:phosphoglycolate phosphatase
VLHSGAARDPRRSDGRVEDRLRRGAGSGVELIVFDLDGTLIDSRRDLADAANALIHERGGNPIDEDRIARMVGEGAAVLVQRALAAASVEADGRALPRFLALYDERLLRTTKPYTGTLEMLEALVARCGLAVLTNKPLAATTRILDGLGLSRFFGTVVGGDNALGRKPDPAALLDVIHRSGATPSSTLLVGDSAIDVATGERAGVRVAVARFGFGYRPEEIDATVPRFDSPAELPALVTSFAR